MRAFITACVVAIIVAIAAALALDHVAAVATVVVVAVILSSGRAAGHRARGKDQDHHKNSDQHAHTPFD